MLGDGDAGVTSALITYTENKYPSEYVPTFFDNYAVTVMLGGEPYTLGLYQVAGQEDYDTLRPLSYPNTDVFIVAYSIASQSSFESVKEKWVPEIRLHCPNVPFILVGLKEELRYDAATLEKLKQSNKTMISYGMGFRLAKTLGAATFCECSAITQNGLKDLFDEAILATFEDFETTQRSNFCPNLMPCIYNKNDSVVESLTIVEDLLQTTSPREALRISEQISKRYSDINDEIIQVRLIPLVYVWYLLPNVF